MFKIEAVCYFSMDKIDQAEFFEFNTDKDEVLLKDFTSAFKYGTVYSPKNYRFFFKNKIKIDEDTIWRWSLITDETKQLPLFENVLVAYCENSNYNTNLFLFNYLGNFPLNLLPPGVMFSPHFELLIMRIF